MTINGYKGLLFNYAILPNYTICESLMKIIGRFKSKETDFVGFITKIHISRYVNPIFMFFMLKNSQHFVALEYICICFLKKPLFFIRFDF